MGGSARPPAPAPEHMQELAPDGDTECLRGRGGPRCLSRQLLQHECPQCPELPPFGLFGDLEQHMRKQHELFCCKLCLKHLKVRPGPRSPPGGPGRAGCRRLGARPLVPLALQPHPAQAGGCSWCVRCCVCMAGGTEAALCRGAMGRGLPTPSTLFPADLHLRAQMVLAQGPGTAPHAGGPRRHVTPRAPALQVL